jgi:fused signal recognition particle receptor
MDDRSLVLALGGLLVVVLVVALVLWRRRRRPAVVPAVRAGAPAAPVPADRLRRGLEATRRKLAAQLDAIIRGGPGGETDVLADVEEMLVAADVGVRTAGAVVASARGQLGRDAAPADVRRVVRAELGKMLDDAADPVLVHRPWVILVTGVNGVGKTTTIGKLAALHAAAGRRVLLVAADTFRAAAIDQLAVWAERTGAEIVRQAGGASPAAVVFDGMKAALARNVDVVLIDTAGRLHTRSNLMDELRKVRRVIEREVPGAPHETLLVLDATTGQNALSQARAFMDAVAVTGVIITKLDGTARGGVVFAVRQELGVPIRYIGVGEAVDDLRSFDPRQFVDALFGDADGAEPRAFP